MKIYIEKQNKNINKKFRGTVKELLTELKINIEEVVIVKNKMIVLEDEILDDKDDVRILSVISGG